MSAQRPKKRPRKFTLVELLVIIAGVLTIVMLAEVRIGFYLNSFEPRRTRAKGFASALVVAGLFSIDCLVPNDLSSQSDDLDASGIVNSTTAPCGHNEFARGMGAYVANGVQQANARSHHIERVVSTCDGSVRTVINTVSPEVWLFMNARDDSAKLVDGD